MTIYLKRPTIALTHHKSVCAEMPGGDRWSWWCWISNAVLLAEEERHSYYGNFCHGETRCPTQRVRYSGQPVEETTKGAKDRKSYMPKAPTNVRAQDEDGDRGQIRAKRGERLCTVSTLEDIEEDIYIYCGQVRDKEEVKWTIILMINLEDINITLVRIE
ncbi:hypothetical protein AAMO2058_000929500 [Amorphochlora amoebiformis]